MSQMFCHACKRLIAPSQAKGIVAGRWWCGDCLYYKERGEEPPKKVGK